MIRRIFPFFFLWGLWAFPAWAGAELDPPYEIHLEAASNYYGQSFGLSVSKRILGPLWADLGVGQGSFSVDVKPGATFLVFKNDSGYEYGFGLDLRDFVSLSLSFHREEKGMLRWLNSLGLGLSYYDLSIFASQYDEGTADYYQGHRDMSTFALYTVLQLVDFHVPDDHLSFSLGIQGSTAFLASPQSILMKDSSGYRQVLSIHTKDGSPILIPYLELFLAMGYGFN